ncbi:MAG: CvpA family protein [Proteobacteria bacterium]|nr:CvpA family protein [Pseudomonadota bacterium]MDA1331696.1 CvpA family protein [Pseudomonadota bacterium]
MELNLNWFDYGFIAVLLISTIYGFYRGFTLEIFSLLTWVLAVWTAKVSVAPISGLFDQVIISPRLRLIVIFVVVLILALFLFHFLTVKLCRLIKASALTGMDRALGALFGLTRGVLISALAVIIFSSTEFSRKHAWQDAQLRFPLEVVASFLQVKMPELDWDISPK